MKLSIAHLTNRKVSKREWFLDSLAHQVHEFPDLEIQVICIDFHLKEMVREEGVVFSPPMPCIWQGPHRVTKRDYFAASTARNTAICLAEGEWIACVDDLSVLMPGWLAAVKRAIDGNYIALGAYKKVKNLVVHDGVMVSHDDYPAGVDSRWPMGKPDDVVPAAGSWLFGCSFAAPVEAFLQINGFDTDLDSMGGEDYIAGMMLEHAKYPFRYDRRMLTLESEELHFVGEVFPRLTKMRTGNSPFHHFDASYAMIDYVQSGGRKVAPNYYGPGGIRALRERVLAGEPFPIPQIPQHHWPDGQPICEM
jgi:hypothetical protein